jgi:hypothetical protein
MMDRERWEMVKVVFVWAMPWLVIALGLALAFAGLVACIVTRVR